MTAYACPRCGRPGGVLLLETVAPCDACAASDPPGASRPAVIIAGIRRRWVRFGEAYPWRSPPADCIGWDAYPTGSFARKADEQFAKLPNPDSPLRRDSWGWTVSGVELLARPWGPGDGSEGWYLEGEL